MLYTWLSILALGLVTILPECRTRMYMVPAAIIIVYIFFNEYPSAVRRMHRRKLTYEDLEDFRDADPELRQRLNEKRLTIGGKKAGESESPMGPLVNFKEKAEQ